MSAPDCTGGARPPLPNDPKFKDETGKVYGRWTVLGYAGAGKHAPGSLWECRCACGTVRPVKGTMLRAGKSCSCGCLLRDAVKTHGQSNTRLFWIWWGLQKRCYCPNVLRYCRYGGRGIRVCDRWRGPEGFANFAADMGPRPSPAHEIDRIDNDGDYEPGNCHWATRHEQSRNTSATRLLTHDGKTLCVHDWAERTGLGESTIHGRLRRGWPVARALAEPAAARGELTATDIPRIRALSREGVSHRKLASLFRVSRANIQSVLSGRTWRHAP